MTFARIGIEGILEAGAALTDAAFRTHIEACAWSAARLLDERVPHRDVRRFAETTVEIDNVIAELLAREWWLDLGEHYDIGHRFRWQWTRSQVDAYREREREKKRRQRAAIREKNALKELTP